MATYESVKKMMEKDAEISRDTVVKKLKINELQATAWMSRYRTEVEAAKRAAKLRRPPEPKLRPDVAKRAKPSTSRGRAGGRER